MSIIIVGKETRVRILYARRSYVARLTTAATSLCDGRSAGKEKGKWGAGEEQGSKQVPQLLELSWQAVNASITMILRSKDDDATPCNYKWPLNLLTPS